MRLRGGKRQKNQLELAFDPPCRGETSASGKGGTETLRAAQACQGPAPTGSSNIGDLVACLTSRTAVYGPVRTVVWEGRESRGSPPIPISLGRSEAETPGMKQSQTPPRRGGRR